MVSAEYQSYQSDLEESINKTIEDTEELLEYSKQLIARLQIRSYVKQKTVYRLNVFSAVYQRAQGIIVLSRARQTNDIAILLRSMWEHIADHRFVGMDRGNKYLEILKGVEYLSDLKQWRSIKRLREDYPDSETWRIQWSDKTIEDRIAESQSRLDQFNLNHPNANLEHYSRLLNRMKNLDDYNIVKYPKYRLLNQMEYRTIYSLMSQDVHSSIYGTIENSRFIETGMQIRLDKFDLDTLRYLTTMYNMYLDFISFIAVHYRLNDYERIRLFKSTAKNHHTEYIDLDKRRDAIISRM